MIFDLTKLGLTQEECDRLNLDYHTWNGDPQEHEPGNKSNLVGYDFALMSYFASKLRKEVDGDLLYD